MIVRIIQWALLAAAMMCSQLAVAAQPVDKAVIDKLRASLEIPGNGLKLGEVATSEIPGIYQVQFINGPMIYTNAEGSHFIVGDMFAVENGSYVNLGDRRRDGERMEKLSQVKEEDMIVFSPEGEPRAYVSVFTDITCGFCQKLHREVPELNRRGVEVRYLAYPRAGIDSGGYRQLATAWCADNPQETLTKLKSRQAVPEKVCEDNPIATQYQLGQALGVRGTPAIVTQDGEMLPGYMPADELIMALGLEE
jgi:thiol:disulfide interchange protein DsbC